MSYPNLKIIMGQSGNAIAQMYSSSTQEQIFINLIRDSYTLRNDFRKASADQKTKSGKQDIPYDKVRKVLHWVGHVDCAVGSTTGQSSSSEIYNLFNAYFWEGSITHAFGSSTPDPTANNLSPTVTTDVDVPFEEHAYDYSQGGNPLTTDLWYLKQVQINDNDDGMGTRVTVALENFTDWKDVVELIDGEA
jgi:hypothetical protein